MKDRLIEFLAYLGIGQTKFEEKVGLSRGFVNVLKENMTVRTLEKITDKYPELNEYWLRTGEGDMLKPTSTQRIGSISGNNNGVIGNVRVSGGNNRNIGNISTTRNDYGVTSERNTGEGKCVPYYDVDFIGGLDSVENDQTITPVYYIDFPQYAKAESWVNVTGHSMEPLINHGDMIAIKKLEKWDTYLLYGEVYAIVTDEYRTIKYVRKSTKGDDYLRLIPANTDFDEQDIPKSVVRGMFQILGCAKKF